MLEVRMTPELLTEIFTYGNRTSHKVVKGLPEGSSFQSVIYDGLKHIILFRFVEPNETGEIKEIIPQFERTGVFNG